MHYTTPSREIGSKLAVHDSGFENLRNEEELLPISSGMQSAAGQPTTLQCHVFPQVVIRSPGDCIIQMVGANLVRCAPD